VAEVINATHPVLIWGAPGTGKALITETIHLASQRKRFVLVNCGVFSETTLERNLFGFQQGAFWEATEDQPGLLEQATGGTLVLDEINNLSPRLQHQLLSALHHQQTRRLGSAHPIDIEVRVLATSPLDLSSYVASGLFSAEFYEYLSGSIIQLPLLKERRDEQTDDVLLLAGHFLDKYASDEGPLPTMSDSARRLLQTYDFPHNVRELEEAIRVAIVQTRSGVIEPYHLPEQIRKPTHSMPRVKLIRDVFPADVICPCGRSLSSQAETAAQAFDTAAYVYLSAGTMAPPWYQSALEDTIAQFGLTLYKRTSFANQRDFCTLCQPILSSWLAILDVSAANPATFFDLGLVHALGVPYLVLRRNDAYIPDRLAHLPFFDYYDKNSLCESISRGLNQLAAATGPTQNFR
jgi:DNA-binding NtrC family response regulator